jgi:DNA-binding LytR/AlgR family response regulator
MPELSGIEFARIIPKETKIIFTTAFDQYALHGYKVNAIDYLLKPISYNDFIMSADKALEWFSSLKNKTNDDGNRFIMIKSDYKLIRISLDDILYIEGQKDYVRIYMNNGEKIMSLINLKTLEQHLPEPEFMRTHRSYIVHMDKITVLDRLRIVFGNKHIPISDSYKDNIMSYFDKHTLS